MHLCTCNRRFLRIEMIPVDVWAQTAFYIYLFWLHLLAWKFDLHPRRAGGCLNTPPPSGFSQIVGKRRRGAPPFLAQLFIHLFRTLCENFGPRSLKVRSPGHVKCPHLRKTLNVRHSYTEWPITLKLSAMDIRTSIYETYISEFWYRWPKVRSILRPLHYKSMGEKWKAPLLHENHSKHSKTSGYR